ncbi:hypothetical protein [Thalassotalea sp. SU-HH00458]|uniref:hypothetical protein n=1 Tax=Thalassotalea sp. SU-HH00458 TaxID=3127657 RepID=UPI0031058A27
MLINFAKYKHYLIIISALMLVNYLIIPLVEYTDEQQESLTLLVKKQTKVESLFQREEFLNESLQESSNRVKNYETVLFDADNDEDFKLIAQSIIEKAIMTGGCTIERIGFKGDTPISANIKRWQLETRYRGDIRCLVSTTRAIESLTPYVKIFSYNFNHRGLTKVVDGMFNAQMTFEIWSKQ